MKYDEFYKLCEKVYEPITNFENLVYHYVLLRMNNLNLQKYL